MRWIAALTLTAACSDVKDPVDTGVHGTAPLADDTGEPLDPDVAAETGRVFVINEIMPDGEGDTPDWIELYNGTSRLIELTDYVLTDDPTLEDGWKFPDDYDISPDERIVLWADEGDTERAGLHLNFRLSEDGERVYLLDAVANEVDAVTYPRLETEQAYARTADGAEGWTVTDDPTPGEPN